MCNVKLQQWGRDLVVLSHSVPGGTLRTQTLFWLLVALPLSMTTSLTFLNSLLSSKQAEVLSAAGLSRFISVFCPEVHRATVNLPCGHVIKIQMVLVRNPFFEAVFASITSKKKKLLCSQLSVSEYQHHCSETKWSDAYQTSVLCHIFQTTSSPASSQDGSFFDFLHVFHFYFATLEKSQNFTLLSNWVKHWCAKAINKG